MSQDRLLQEAVRAEFMSEPSVTAAHIGVTANNGIVTLTGSVETPADRYIAGATAWGAPGATQVENALIIA